MDRAPVRRSRDLASLRSPSGVPTGRAAAGAADRALRPGDDRPDARRSSPPEASLQPATRRSCRTRCSAAADRARARPRPARGRARPADGRVLGRGAGHRRPGRAAAPRRRARAAAARRRGGARRATLPRPDRRVDPPGGVDRRERGARFPARPPAARARRPAEEVFEHAFAQLEERREIVDEIADGFGWIGEERAAPHVACARGRRTRLAVRPSRATGVDERVRALGEPAGSSSCSTATAATAPRWPQRLGVPHHVVPGELPGTPFGSGPCCGSAGGGRWRSGGRNAASSSSRTRSARSRSSAPAPSRRACTRSSGCGRRARCAASAPDHLLVGHGEGIHGHAAGRAVDAALRTVPPAAPRWLAGISADPSQGLLALAPRYRRVTALRERPSQQTGPGGNECIAPEASSRSPRSWPWPSSPRPRSAPSTRRRTSNPR